MAEPQPALVVTGATGRVGRLLRAAWAGNHPGGMRLIWHARRAGPGVDLAWDIGRESPPEALSAGAIILHLAGRTSGSAAELDDNALSARALGAFAASQGARVLFMSTAAVYAPGPRDLEESDTPDPPGAYGSAKLAAEHALGKAMGGQGLTILRLANLAGADVLFGNIRAGLPITLDPVPGQAGGPLRSYIGPQTLAGVLAALVARLRAGDALPPLLNLAQPGAIAMADVLRASGANWSFGPPRAGAIPRVTLATERLQALTPVAEARAEGLVAEVAALTGGHP